MCACVCGCVSVGDCARVRMCLCITCGVCCLHCGNFSREERVLNHALHGKLKVTTPGGHEHLLPTRSPLPQTHTHRTRPIFSLTTSPSCPLVSCARTALRSSSRARYPREGHAVPHGAHSAHRACASGCSTALRSFLILHYSVSGVSLVHLFSLSFAHSDSRSHPHVAEATRSP